MLQRYIFIWLLLSSGLAFVWPEFQLNFDPFLSAGGRAMNILIMVIMFCVGSLLTVREVDGVFRRWPTVLLGTAVQYLSMPLLAWIVVRIMQPDPETATGLLIVGCVPGAMASNVLTLTARGNVSYSVSLTTLATLLSPFVVPLTLWLTVDSSVNYDGWAAVRLMLFQIVVPVVSGHLLTRPISQPGTGHQQQPGSVTPEHDQVRGLWSHWLSVLRFFVTHVAAVAANISILGVIAIAVALNRSGVQQTSLYLLLALASINFGGYLCGYFGARMFRLPESMRRALTLEVGMQNAGAGIALAKQLFGDASAAVIPCILYTFGCMLTGTILATVWQRISIQDEV